MICSNCWQQISGDVKFCPHCGNAVGSIPSQPTTPNPPNLHRDGTKQKGIAWVLSWIGVGLGASSIILALGIYLLHDGSSASNTATTGSASSTATKPKERTVDPNGIYFRCPSQLSHQYTDSVPRFHEVDWYVISAQKDNFDYFSKFLSFEDGQLHNGLLGLKNSYSWTINRTADWDNVSTNNPQFADAAPDLENILPKHSWYHFDGTISSIDYGNIKNITAQQSRYVKWSDYPYSVMIDKDRLVIDTVSTGVDTPIQCSAMSRADAQRVVDKYWEFMDHIPPEEIDSR